MFLMYKPSLMFMCSLFSLIFHKNFKQHLLYFIRIVRKKYTMAGVYKRMDLVTYTSIHQSAWILQGQTDYQLNKWINKSFTSSKTWQHGMAKKSIGPINIPGKPQRTNFPLNRQWRVSALPCTSISWRFQFKPHGLVPKRL